MIIKKSIEGAQQKYNYVKEKREKQRKFLYGSKINDVYKSTDRIITRPPSA